jgi:hypothetical protein
LAKAAKEKATVREGVLSLDISTAWRRLLKAIGRLARRWVAVGGVVTLDIDGTTVRLLETRGGAVKNWVSAPLETRGSLEEEMSAEPESLGTIVKKLMNSSGIKTKKVVVSISGLYSVIRIVPMSTLNPNQVTEEALEELVRETMPLAEDKLYMSWQTITPDEGEQQAFLVGVPKEVIDEEVQSLKAAGISPSILELKAMALTKTVNRKQAIILNIEPSAFDIAIVVNGMPEIVHTVPWKPEKLSAEDKPEHLATHLELTVEFYNLHHPDAHLDPAIPLFVTGQMSEETIPKDKLQARLGFPVESLSPPLEYPADFPISEFAVNIGLALSEAKLSESYRYEGYKPLDVNLLPKVYRPWRPSAKQIYISLAFIVATALLIPLYQMTSHTMAQTAGLQAQFELLNSELEGRKLEIAERDPLQKAISEYNTIVNLGGNFTEDLDTILGEADRLGVQIKSVVHEIDEITITCESDSYLAFRQYLAALEESGRFLTPIPPPEGYPYTTSGTIIVEPKTEAEAETEEP